MGRFEAYKGLIEYYKDANRLCNSLCPKCEWCPLHVTLEDGEDGCDRSILSFSLSEVDGKANLCKALYKMYVVSEWADKHPEEDTNDVI